MSRTTVASVTAPISLNGKSIGCSAESNSSTWKLLVPLCDARRMNLVLPAPMSTTSLPVPLNTIGSGGSVVVVGAIDVVVGAVVVVVASVVAAWVAGDVAGTVVGSVAAAVVSEGFVSPGTDVSVTAVGAE